MKVALHVQFSWLKNKHEKQRSASGSVTLTRSWPTHTPTLFLTPCPHILFPQGCSCRQVSLLWPLTALGAPHFCVPGCILFPQLSTEAGQDQRMLAMKNFQTPDTQAEHRPLVPRLPDTWKGRSGPTVAYSVCSPGLCTPFFFSRFSLQLSPPLKCVCQCYEGEMEGPLLTTGEARGS